MRFLDRDPDDAPTWGELIWLAVAAFVAVYVGSWLVESVLTMLSATPLGIYA